jgi:hypothetical protein
LAAQNRPVEVLSMLGNPAALFAWGEFRPVVLRLAFSGNLPLSNFLDEDL